MQFLQKYLFFVNPPLVKLFIRCISVGFTPIWDNSLRLGINSGIQDTNSALNREGGSGEPPGGS